MNRVTVLIGAAVLAALAGCAKKEAPQVQEDDEDVAETVTQVQPAPVKPEPTDRAEAAAGMIASIDPGPQCQIYRDDLEAKGRTPGPIDDLSAIFVQAYEAGCGMKKPQ